MATTTTPTPITGLNAQDQAFMDGFYEALKDSTLALNLYKTWGTALSKKPTHDGKLAYIRDIINNPNLASKYRAKLPDLGVKWLVDSNPGVVDSKGDAFSTDFYKGIISGDAKTRTANSTALNTAKTKIATESVKLANPKATPAEVDAMVADIVNGSTTKPYTPAEITKAITTSPSADLYKPGSMTAAELKTKYGAITDPDTGKPLFSDDYFTKLAAATTSAGTQGFNDTLSKVASKVLTSQKGSNYLVQSDADKANALSDLLKNPDKIASGAKSLFTSTQTKGIDGLLPVGTFKDANGNFVYNGGEIQPENMSEFVQKFATQDKGEYHAPVFDEVSQTYKASPLGKATSPYANTLYSLLGSAKNPFASDYKSSLESRQPAAMTSTQLASLNNPFKDNPTAKDLLNLQNSAGMIKGNELTKGSSLSPNLIDLYQTNPDGSAINSPWVADTDLMKIPTTTIPTIDTSTELVQLDPGGLLTGNTVVDPNLADNQATADKIAADKAAADKAAADKATADAGGKKKKSGGFQPDRDIYGQVLYRNPYGTGEYIDNAVDATFNDTFRNHPYWGSYIEKGLVNISNSEKEAWINQALAETMPKDRGPKPIVDPALEAWRRAADQLDTQRRIEEEIAKKAMQNDYYSRVNGPDDSKRLIFALNNNLNPGQRYTPEFEAMYYASNPSTVVGGLGNDSIKSGMGNDSIKSGMGTDIITSGNTGFVSNGGKSDWQIGAGLLNQTPDGTVQNTTLLPPGKLYTPQLDAAITQQRQGALGIAGNPNVGGFTTADNMNTNVTGVGAPITSLLTPNTGAASTPNIQNTGIANQQVAPTYTQANYITPETRNGMVFQNALKADPSLKAMADWSAAQDASR
jgi:hypothetical protein